MEIIKELNLGQWATFVIVVAILWKTVFKSLVDSWFRNRLDLQKQELGIALQIQKDIALKQAEFEKVKLERVLPLFEKLNAAISEHRMIFNTYISYVENKSEFPEELESKRLEEDRKMLEAISALSIYLPDEFRSLVYRLRMVVSCYMRKSKIIATNLRDLGGGVTIPPLAQALYTDLIDCFHSMCAKYLGISGAEKTYSQILSQYHLDEKAQTTRNDPEHDLAYKFLLLHEFFSSGQQVDAQNRVESFYQSGSE